MRLFKATIVAVSSTLMFSIGSHSAFAERSLDIDVPAPVSAPASVTVEQLVPDTSLALPKLREVETPDLQPARGEVDPDVEGRMNQLATDTGINADLLKSSLQPVSTDDLSADTADENQNKN